MSAASGHFLERLRIRAARGFTLLELLLAVGALVVIASMIATLWSQARDWVDSNSELERSMRLPRVLEVMRRQWADRRTAGIPGMGESGVGAEPDRVQFLTATPLLFGDWPMVQAAYIVERRIDTAPDGGPLYDLVYEELRVSRLDEAPEGEGADITGRAVRDRHVMLGGVERLRLERFGFEFAESSNRGRVARGTPEEEERRRREEQRRRAAQRDGDEEDRVEWRPFVEPFDGPVYALKVCGVYEGEEFACVLVVQALR